MPLGKVYPTQRLYYLQTEVILKERVILPLKKFGLLRRYEVMLRFRGVKLQFRSKPLRRNLTQTDQ